MSTVEPELIEIIEGPTPEFQPAPQFWPQAILEYPEIRVVAICQLRTGNGRSIVERCRRAWREGRPVRLDFPDQIRLRRQVDVVSLKLGRVEEGELLNLWVALPVADMAELQDDNRGEDEDDGLAF